MRLKNKMIKNFKEIIEQLKSQIPIHELISEYIPIKKAGRGYVCLCPFHDDHKPSLQINSQKGIFKCFSCGTGGDLITFYALINKKKWSDSVPELAVKYGIKVEYSDKGASPVETEIKNKLYELNRVVLDFYKRQLYITEGKTALDYLTNERKLNNKIITTYELGYAPNSWNALYNYLTKEKNCHEELLIASGLFVIKENNQGYYDRFRNRLIIPIFNENNNVVGFGGRALNNEDVKYINSPETLIFNKGSNLYGLNFAKNEIKIKDYVLLTEGYLDVITAHQNNLLNTVATLGTAFTSQQARLLTKYTESKKIMLCLDSDFAGKKAVESIFRQIQEISKGVKLDVRVVTDLPGKDLDESINLEGVESILKKINDSQKLVNFVFDRITSKYLNAKKEQNDIEKQTIMYEIVDIVISMADPIERNENIKYIAHKTNLDEELINLKIKEKVKSNKKRHFTKESMGKEPEEDELKMHSYERYKHAEIDLLILYISSFPASNEVKNEINAINFIDEKHKLIKDFLDNLPTEEFQFQGPHEVLNKLILEFNEYKHIMNLISEIAWRIDTEADLFSAPTKKDKIIREAKESINWWVTNKHSIKDLTTKLKESKNTSEESDILVQIYELVKNKKIIDT